MAKTRKIEQRTVACSVYLLLFLALSGAICWKAPTAHAADEQSYEVEIAGRSFDPKSPKLDIPLELRLSPAALEKYKKEAGYYLVQLHRSPDAETSTQLKAHLGVKLQDYVPELSYVEKLTPSAVAAAKADPRIRSVIPYEPAFKLSPHIGTFVPRTAERKAAPGLLLTAFLFPDADVDAVSRSIASVGGTGMQALDDRRLKGGTARIQFSLPSDSGLPEMARIEGIRGGRRDHRGQLRRRRDDSVGPRPHAEHLEPRPARQGRDRRHHREQRHPRHQSLLLQGSPPRDRQKPSKGGGTASFNGERTPNIYGRDHRG
jgi:hypothetical protein